MTKSRQEIINDGRFAERLMKDEDFTRFLAEVDSEIFNAFCSTSAGDTEQRELLYAQKQGVDFIRSRLRAMVDNATLEEKGKK